MMNQTQEKDILRFLKHTVLPAMRELRQELISKYELSVQINTLFDQDEPAVELVIQKDLMRDFYVRGEIYRSWGVRAIN